VSLRMPYIVTILPILVFSNSYTGGGVVLGEDGKRNSSSSSILSSLLKIDDGVEGGDDLMASIAHT